MKYRTGFVSNSSSSSFVCDVTGREESGMDISMNDIDMQQCSNGHTFSGEVALFTFETLPDAVKIRMAAEDKVSFYDYYKDAEGNYRDQEVARDMYNHAVGEYILAHTKEELLEMFDNEEYDEDAQYGWSVPVEMCPICSMFKWKKTELLTALVAEMGFASEQEAFDHVKNVVGGSYKEFKNFYLTKKE